MIEIEEGRPAPLFTLPDQDGNEVSLSDLLGKIVVLYFYPKDNTPGCTRQACAFRDSARAFSRRSAVVLGVSPDSVASHRKFADGQSLPFTLLSDATHSVAESYGVWKEKTLYGRKFMGIERTTFVIDRMGVVRKIFPRVRVDGHAEKVLEVVKAL